MSKQSVYTFNNDYFSELTNDSCNIAGFIAGDGCIYKNMLSITLKKEDTIYLESIKKELKYTGDIKTYSKQNGLGYSSLKIHRLNELKKDLEINFSITERKSLTLKKPNIKILSHSLSFITGLLDADGSLGFCTLKKSNKTYVYLNLVGTLEVLTYVSDIFNKIVPGLKGGSNPRCRGNYYSLDIVSRRAEEIIKLLLLNKVSFRLNRKWDQFSYLLNNEYFHKDMYKNYV